MSDWKKGLLPWCRHCQRAVAVGMWLVCKSWVCVKDAVKVFRQAHYSWNALQKKPQPATSTPLQSKYPRLTVQSFVALFAAAFALCTLFFGIWSMIRVQSLSQQNKILKEKRIELLGQIKERNKEIADLRNRIDSPSITTTMSSRNRKNAFVVHTEPPVPAVVDGLPVSFDNGTVQKRLVALTFDGNDQANAAADILDTLKSRNIRATVFLTGKFIRRNADVVGRIIAEGHEIGNHTFSHPHLTSYAQDHTQTVLPTVSEEFLHNELVKTDSIFRSMFGVPLAPLWRAPYGEGNRIISLWGRHAGFLPVGWRQGKTWRLGLDSNDWTPDEETPGYHSPRQVFEKIVGLAHSGGSGINGGIILMHLNSARLQKEQQVHHVLGRLIDTLQAAGYRFVTVGEMLRESDLDMSRLKRN